MNETFAMCVCIMLYLAIGFMLFQIFDNTAKRIVSKKMYCKLPVTMIFSAIFFFWLPIAIVLLIRSFVEKENN